MKILPLFCVLLPCLIWAQSPTTTFLDLDFEQVADDGKSSSTWSSNGNGYTTQLDATAAYAGNYALRIQANEKSDAKFGNAMKNFPAELVAGKQISYTVMIKTEEVTHGYAGIWWRADGADDVLAFDNSQTQFEATEAGWVQHEITLDIPDDVVNVSFGMLLSGPGTAWFDDVKVTIDGQPYVDKVVAYRPLSDSQRAYLQERIIPLHSCDPSESRTDDLAALTELIGPAQVVALGESTHGSRAIFQLKHRIFQYLATTADFRHFSLEANLPEAYQVNDFTQEGEGEAADYLRNMFFWTWQTEEVASLLEWMQTYNKSQQEPLQFSGFDMQTYEGSIAELEALLFPEDTLLLNKIVAELAFAEAQAMESTQRHKSFSPLQEEWLNEQFTQLRARLVSLHTDDKTLQWGLLNLRVVEQFLTLTSQSRDRYMAENMQAIRAQNPEQKMVIWAHNGHIEQTRQHLGQYLHEAMGEAYLSIGFMFYEGEYSAIGPNGLTSYTAQPAPKGSYEYLFQQLDTPIFALDLRGLNPSLPELDCLAQALSLRDIGSTYRQQAFSPTDLFEDFDVVIFIRKTEASKLLK